MGNIGSGSMNSNKDSKTSKDNIIRYGKREQQKQRERSGEDNGSKERGNWA